MTKLAKKLI